MPSDLMRSAAIKHRSMNQTLCLKYGKVQLVSLITAAFTLSLVILSPPRTALNYFVCQRNLLNVWDGTITTLQMTRRITVSLNKLLHVHTHT